MGKYLHQQYDEQFNEDLKYHYHAECSHYDEYEDEDEYEYEDIEYIPRIKGTELIFSIKVFSFKYFPILTSRISDNKEKYYLFDFIKIWQKDVEPDFTDYDEFY